MQLIYIVEDDKNIREIESFALKNSGYEAEDFTCAREFYTRLIEKVPDLIVLDFMLPDEDGLSIIRRVRRTPEAKKTPIILVTAKTTEMDKVKGLDTGADDYMTKPFGVMELLSRVRALLRRSMGDEQEKSLSIGEITLDAGRHAVSVNGEPCELTFKEYELLHFLMRNAGIVMKRDVLMERIWGIDFEGSSRTLDMHIKTLRQKLGSAGAMIRTIRNVGYLLE